MLQNAHVLVTRPQEHASRLCHDLRERGAIPVLYAGLSYVPCDNIMLLDAEIAKAANGLFDAVILTSRQAAQIISERLSILRLSWRRVTVWTVGAQTAAACHFEAQIHTPSAARDALTLLESLPSVQGQRIFLPQSPRAAPTLYESLIERGADVMVVHPYQVSAGEGGDEAIDLLRQGQIRAMTFFSGSAVEGTLSRLELSGLNLSTVEQIPAVCFGASTAAVARQMGLSVWEGDATYDTFYRLLTQACA